MIADLCVDGNEFRVAHRIVGNVHSLADHVDADGRHEFLFEEGNGGVCKERTAVFCGIGDDAVHFVELFAVDEVCDERHFVQRFVIRAFRHNARFDHRFEREFAAALYHGDEQNALIEILLFGNRIARFFGRFKRQASRRLPPRKQIAVAVVPIFHHRPAVRAADDIVHVFAVKRRQQCFQAL